MKCHSILCLLVIIGGQYSWVQASPEAETLSVDELTAEHRSAKPEPFLDKIAAFFSGNTRKQDKPTYQHGAASVPRPQYVRPPVPPKPPVRPPNLLKRPPPPNKPQPVYSAGNKIDQNPSASSNFNSFASPGAGGGFSADPWQQSQPSNMAMIKDLQVQCEKDMMRVRILFDRPFYGMVFSKGHYSNVNCVHVPSGLGQTQATFDISLSSCGMTSSVNNGYGNPTPQGSFIENTIIIQYDPLLQEVWDQARRLRCTWYDFYEKAVTFRPYQVDMLDPVTANFLGDNLRCWMQIQVGKGPQASEVSGIVKIGQTMTMVLGVKDDENKFDMMVRNCVAHDGTRAPIQLVDEKGCVTRPKIMSPFKKVKNFDATANVLAYAYFQAFKFPDSMNVHFQCVVQVCRGACPDPQCGGGGGGGVLPPSRPNQDSYGAPAAQVDSYGSPAGSPLGPTNRVQNINPNINPRRPNGATQRVYQTAGSNPQPSYIKPPPEALVDVKEPEKIVLSEPGYGEINKRMGLAAPLSLGGKPRSLDVEDENFGDQKSRDAKSALKDVNTVDSASGDDFDVNNKDKNSRRRRSPAKDANGNRILRVVKRDATEMAEVETTEKIIQVLAPNDVQFSLPFTNEESEDSIQPPENIVIQSNSYDNSLCVDTSAFVGITVVFLMILIVALITILFLWLRIKSLDSNNAKKRCF